MLFLRVLSRSEQRLGAGVIALALVGSLLPGRSHHFEYFFRWTGFLLWSRFLRHTQVSHRPNDFAIPLDFKPPHSHENRGAAGFWRTIPVSACEGCMLHKGQESSSRRLVWGQTSRRWGCSECGWVFNPSGPTGNSIDEMMRNFQVQLSVKFASHACANHPRIKGAKLAS